MTANNKCQQLCLVCVQCLLQMSQLIWHMTFAFLLLSPFLRKLISLDSLRQSTHTMIWSTACRQGANSCFVWSVQRSSIVYNLFNPVRIDWRKEYCNIQTQQGEEALQCLPQIPSYYFVIANVYQNNNLVSCCM